MKLYLKIFLFCGIPYGLLMGAYWSSFAGISAGMLGGLIAGLLFGGFMAVILGTIHIIGVRGVEGRESNDLLCVHQRKSMEINRSYQSALGLCRESLSTIGRNEILKEDSGQGYIEAKTALNRKTFGEFVAFRLQKINDDVTRIEVSSRPCIRTTIVDYGKNLDNVLKIMRFLHEKNTA